MNIWLLQTGETLPINQGARKMRTAILADKLVDRGHSVLWWASAFEHQRKIWISSRDKNITIKPDYKIRVLRGSGYKTNISPMRYIDHLLVSWKFRHQCKKFDLPDIMVISMPCYHLAYQAMRYAIQKNIPFLVDIRDLWPDIFLEPLNKIGFKKLGRLALAWDFYKLSLLLRNSNGLIGISKGLLNWGLNIAKRPPDKWDKVFFHGYKDSTQPLEPAEKCPVNDPAGRKIFLFVGTFGDSYELELIVDVAKRLNREGAENILFYIAGTGDQYDLLKKKAEQLPNVVLPGWVDAAEIKTLLSSAWAGIVPCRSVIDAAPNKVFEYLSAGLPLISSLEGEIEQIIDDRRIGLNYRAGDAKDLYGCVKTLAGDEQLRAKMAQSAAAFFNERGSADRIYNEYSLHIENLAESLKIKRDRMSHRRI